MMYHPLILAVRQAHPEPGARFRAITLRSDRATVRFDDVFGDGKTEAEAAVLPCRTSVTLAKAFEDVSVQIARQSGAIIGNLEDGSVAAIVQGHRDVPAARRELDGVRKQVGSHLLNTARVSDGWRGCIEL
jgi:hypothetical protein